MTEKFDQSVEYQSNISLYCTVGDKKNPSDSFTSTSASGRGTYQFYDIAFCIMTPKWLHKRD